MNKNIFPRCAKTFKQWCKTNNKYYLFNKHILKEPKPFDTTLRDGLQGLKLEEQGKFTLRDKLNLYHRLRTKHDLYDMEIGSLVSKKIMPIFSDTLDLYHCTQIYKKNINYTIPNNYILIPNKKKLKLVINNKLVNHFSFITSVSNSFQLRNTNMTLIQSDQEIYEMLYELDDNITRTKKANIKLYVSCINECPIEGKIDNDFIIHRLLHLQKMNVDTICLSDTLGTLELEDFEYIIDTCKYFGLPMSQVSLHLHVQPKREEIVRDIIYMALDRKIFNFDVSELTTGGCSVTINKSQLMPNLSYEMYYKTLCNYIIRKTNIN